MATQTQTGIVNNTINPPPPIEEEQPITSTAPITPEVQAAPAEPYKAPEVKPITTQVDAPTETVESRLGDITAKGSRYTDLAKSDAIRQANTRGLINTTMAGAAGTEAAIRAALPIAQQDAKTFTDTRMVNQRAQNEFLKNRQSANLNMEVAEFDSTLNTNFEKTMQDARFSDEAKIQILTTMNSITRDSQAQITEIGLSDRSAEQQVSAIKMVQASRDAELAVYQDLLESFPDWDWGTDFTPKTSEATSPEAMLEPKPTEPPIQGQGEGVSGKIRDVLGRQISSGGDWVWSDTEWVPAK